MKPGDRLVFEYNDPHLNRRLYTRGTFLGRAGTRNSVRIDKCYLERIDFHFGPLRDSEQMGIFKIESEYLRPLTLLEAIEEALNEQ